MGPALAGPPQGMLLKAMGEAAEAEAQLRRSAAVWAAAPGMGPRSTGYATAINNVGLLCYEQVGRPRRPVCGGDAAASHGGSPGAMGA